MCRESFWFNCGGICSFASSSRQPGLFDSPSTLWRAFWIRFPYSHSFLRCIPRIRSLNMFSLLSLVTLASVVGAHLTPVLIEAQPTATPVVTCIEVASPNAFTNPSWEDGTAGWTYTFPMVTTDAYSDDGSKSLYETPSHLCPVANASCLTDMDR